MDWQSLLATDRLQAHTPSAQEMAQLRAVIDRDLKDAVLPGLSEDRRFATAYNAVLQLAKMVIACAGYRVTARQGHHQASFQALSLAMGAGVADLVTYFDTCRRKRNLVDYDRADQVSETEAQELCKKAQEFRTLVEVWIAQHHPQLIR
ncbi:MAG: hypothetical protein IT369_22655 [Candidatus Latescibacteria bacterium]|nr:hypothetical protein [Candidatus Latescibacterota bacterium]